MTAINTATSCQSSLTVTVDEVINNPVASFTSALSNGQLNLVSTGNGAAVWNLGNGQQVEGQNVTISFAASGTLQYLSYHYN